MPGEESKVMALKSFNPYTASRRFVTMLDKSEVTKEVPEKALVETKGEPAKADQPKTDQPKAAQSNVEPAKPAAEKAASRAEKPRHKRYWTEGRIIGELHRHGIYW